MGGEATPTAAIVHDISKLRPLSHFILQHVAVVSLISSRPHPLNIWEMRCVQAAWAWSITIRACRNRGPFNILPLKLITIHTCSTEIMFATPKWNCFLYLCTIYTVLLPPYAMECNISLWVVHWCWKDWWKVQWNVMIMFLHDKYILHIWLYCWQYKIVARIKNRWGRNCKKGTRYKGSNYTGVQNR